MNLDICKHLQYYRHNQGKTSQSVLEFFFFKVTTLNIASTLLTKCEVHDTVKYVLILFQEVYMEIVFLWGINFMAYTFLSLRN